MEVDMLLQILLVPIPACVLSRWRLVIRVALANTYLLAYWLVAIFPIFGCFHVPIHTNQK